MTSAVSCRRRNAAAVLLLGALVVSCRPAGTESAGGSFAAATTHLTVGTTLAFGSLDPVSGDPVLALIAANLYQTPLRVVAETGALAPEAATCSFADPTTYVCSLVPGQAFSNGDPVTGRDLALSIKRAARKGADTGFALMTTVVASGNTVTFTLSAPDATWPYVLAGTAASIVDRGERVGSGPYAISGSVSQEAVELVPNPHYGGSEHRNNAGVTFKHEPDDGALAGDLTAGVIDVAVPGPGSPGLSALQAVPASGSVRGPVDEVRFIGFDENAMPGADADHRLAIRQAIAEAVDRDAIVATLYGGSAEALYTLTPAGSATPPQSSEPTGPDPQAAAATLDAVGVSTPVELKLAYNEDHLGDGALATALQSQLETTGLFTVSLHDVPWVTFPGGVAYGKYGVYLFGGNPGRFADLPSGAADGAMFIPIWQRGPVVVARDVVTGIDAALATPGGLDISELNKRGAE